MEKDKFDEHTSDKKKKRAYRTEYLANIFDIAQKPDEVWLGRENRNANSNDMQLSNYTMIKYYKDTSLVVSGKIEYGEFILKSWYLLRDPNKRRGLLIKK